MDEGYAAESDLGYPPPNTMWAGLQIDEAETHFAQQILLSPDMFEVS